MLRPSIDVGMEETANRMGSLTGRHYKLTGVHQVKS